jgi:hypothetical protein
MSRRDGRGKIGGGDIVGCNKRRDKIEKAGLEGSIVHSDNTQANRAGERWLWQGRHGNSGTS